MQPHQKKVVAINMYDPHEDPKKKQTVAPGPGAYNVVKELPKILEEQEQPDGYQGGGGKLYVESNTDRFGRPIMPKKPFELVPGPGAYDQF